MPPSNQRTHDDAGIPVLPRREPLYDILTALMTHAINRRGGLGSDLTLSKQPISHFSHVVRRGFYVRARAVSVTPGPTSTTAFQVTLVHEEGDYFEEIDSRLVSVPSLRGPWTDSGVSVEAMQGADMVIDCIKTLASMAAARRVK